MKTTSRPLSYAPNSYRSLTFNLIKWILILFAVLNILSSVWVGIYLTQVVRRANEELPDADGHYIEGDRRNSAKIWKGFIIAFLVIIDLVNLIGIFGAFKENYNLSMIFGIILMAYAIFSAVCDYTRGSFASWIMPFVVAVLAFVFAHKIRVEVVQPTVYSSAAPA